jgi:hypothetical protein
MLLALVAAAVVAGDLDRYNRQPWCAVKAAHFQRVSRKASPVRVSAGVGGSRFQSDEEILPAERNVESLNRREQHSGP